MMQSGLLTIGGLVLMSIFLSTGAQSLPESSTKLENCDLQFTEIRYDEITMSWRQECFNGSTSYMIELVGNRKCTETVNTCQNNECSIAIGDMECNSGFPITPCTEVTYTVTGNNADEIIKGSTVAAPYFSKDDWKLKNSTENDSLKVKWGPPANIDFASCATHAKVVATCTTGTDESTTDKVKDITITNVTIAGEATFDISDCIPGMLISTVTYMAEDVPTQTKSSIEHLYLRDGWHTCYVCDSTNSSDTNCNDPFQNNEALLSQPLYQSCVKEDGDGDRAKRYGIRNNETKSNHCFGDGCNGAPINTASMTFFATTIFFIQTLFY